MLRAEQAEGWPDSGCCSSKGAEGSAELWGQWWGLRVWHEAVLGVAQGVLGQRSQTQSLSLGGTFWSQGLDSMILVGPFQLGLFCNSAFSAQ